MQDKIDAMQEEINRLNDLLADKNAQYASLFDEHDALKASFAALKDAHDALANPEVQE